MSVPKPPPPPPRKSTSAKVRSDYERTPLGRDIARFCKEFGKSQFLQIAEASQTAPGKGQIKIPFGGLTPGKDNEARLMQGLGWYWEPLLHDLQFYEAMRDSVPLLSGAYQKFADFVMDGFAIQHSDPEVVDKCNDMLVHKQSVDLDECVRDAVFQLISIANAYRLPIYGGGEGGFSVKTLRPIRATAIRKLRDENLVTQGYVQLLHRPSEFLWGTPAIPTILLDDEVLCGLSYSKDWYAYGVPPLASLPFITKMKVQMMRDLAEMLHQHVPRIDVTYTPEEQMNQDQVDEAVGKVGTEIAALETTDNYVHTPDTVIEYKGPMGKALDWSSSMNYVEMQFFAVLPFSPYALGVSQSAINPIQAQQDWQLTNIIAKRVRIRTYQMFRPLMERIAKELGTDEVPTFRFNDIDVETQQKQAQNDEYQINNAVAMRDAGFMDQDDAAAHATQHRKGGPLQKAAAPGALPPPVDPNKTPPAAGGGSKPAGGKVGDKNKGPKGNGKKTPMPDKRTKGKRHEEFDDVFAEVEERLGIQYVDA